VAAIAEQPTRAQATSVLPSPRHRNRWKWVAAVVAVLAIVAAASAVWVTHDSSSKQNETDLRPFVDRIENVLLQAEPGRHEIADAITGGLACRIPNSQAARQIGSVGVKRQGMLQPVSRR